jgi:hypothetical protein
VNFPYVQTHALNKPTRNMEVFKKWFRRGRRNEHARARALPKSYNFQSEQSQPSIRSMFTMNLAKNADDHLVEINRRAAERPARITA